MGLSTEIDCIYANGMLLLTPTKNEGTAFAEEILSDLVGRGHSGQNLIREFQRISRQIRPAVERLIEEADLLAKEASEQYKDRKSEHAVQLPKFDAIHINTKGFRFSREDANER